MNTTGIQKFRVEHPKGCLSLESYPEDGIGIKINVTVSTDTLKSTIVEGNNILAKFTTFCKDVESYGKNSEEALAMALLLAGYGNVDEPKTAGEVPAIENGLPSATGKKKTGRKKQATNLAENSQEDSEGNMPESAETLRKDGIDSNCNQNSDKESNEDNDVAHPVSMDPSEVEESEMEIPDSAEDIGNTIFALREPENERETAAYKKIKKFAGKTLKEVKKASPSLLNMLKSNSSRSLLTPECMCAINAFLG